MAEYSHTQHIIATAHKMADAAAAIALSYFRQDFYGLTNKSSEGFDPVTLADKEIERCFRDILQRERPHDGIVGEEFPNVASSSGYTWVLDPIDGTRGFISGTPTWGILIAVNDGTSVIFGIIEQPFTGERYVGGLSIAQWQMNKQTRPLVVRPCDKLENAILFSTMPNIGTPEETAAFNRVKAHTLLTRFGMDCYAYALLAIGQIDLVIEAQLKPYDIQAPIAIVNAAGGIITDWQGKSPNQGGQIIAAGDPHIHEAALKLLNL